MSGWKAWQHPDLISNTFTSMWIDPKSQEVSFHCLDRTKRSVVDSRSLGANPNSDLEFGFFVAYHGRLEANESYELKYLLGVQTVNDVRTYDQWVAKRQGRLYSKCVDEGDCGTDTSYTRLDDEGNPLDIDLRCRPTFDYSYRICAYPGMNNHTCDDMDDCESGYWCEAMAYNINLCFNNPAVPNDGVGLQCFGAGTRISTPSGEKNIEDIEVGDVVWSFKPDSQQVVLGEVVRTFEYPSHLGHLILQDGTRIRTTPDHPFFRIDWHDLAPGFSIAFAAHLNPGDTVLSLDESQLQFASVERLEFEHLEQDLVYNFTVQDTHTYFAEGVLVHNR
jgi:hypothetical protein